MLRKWRWLFAPMLVAALSAQAQGPGSLQVAEPGNSVQSSATEGTGLAAHEPCWIGTGCVPQSDLDYNERVANGEFPLVIENGIRPDGPTVLPGWSGSSSEGTQAVGDDRASPAPDLGAISAQYAGEMLGGDAGLACEAILCLAAAGGAPAECSRSLKRYFSIVFKSWTRTLNARRAFLALCPISNSPDMPGLVDALTSGAGLCDLESLNKPITTGVTDASDGVTYVSNVMPAQCEAYYGNAMISVSKPIYVGTPEQGGHWVASESNPEDPELARERR